MPFRKGLSAAAFLLCLSLLVSACQSVVQPPQPTPAAPTASAPTEVPPTPTATVIPPRSLVVCVGQEPQSLYAYAGSSRSMWSILEAIYDGPFDTRQYSAQPVILQKIPSLADGDVVIQPVAVRSGEEVVDANGDLVSLETGTRVFPAGCTGGDCAVQYDGSTALQMDQMSVTFKLLPGLKWSDGSPLSSADSIYSYNLSASPDTPVSTRLVDRTASYTASDEVTVQWVGKPGFLTSRYFANFWLPLPEHLMKDRSAKDMLTAEDVNQRPVGWGPYIINEWVKGDHIALTKNPNYFRASEGLPKFDNLVYRFLGEQADNNLAALQNGECDIVDSSTLLADQLEKLLDLQKAGKLKAAIGQGPEWEHIELGIKPASMDDPANAQYRPNIFGDVRTRQAFAYCMDRKAAVDKQLLGQSAIPDGFLTPDNPFLAKDLAQYPYDPARGSALLDEVGWKDDDNDPATPRVAYGIFGVPDGMKLEVSYLTTQAYLRNEVAKKLAETMQPCGIMLNIQGMTVDELYARGPEGPLFGRDFDMAEFAWQADVQSPCYTFESSRIPNAGNYWVGTNISGYSNPAFDAACSAARQLLPGQPDYAEKNAEVQRLFAQDLPAIPLYFQLKIAASRPDLCGLEMDVTARSALWNLESIDYGEGCAK